MKHTILSLAAVTASLALSSCLTGTSSTITEYDASGRITKTIQTGESVIKTVTDSTKDKTCVVWESGWIAYISVSTATLEDPTPTVKIGAGKVDKGAITIHKNHTALLPTLPAVISSTRQDLSVTKDGISTTK